MNKLSLKDRLNAPQPKQAPQKEAEPKYYKSDIEAISDNLGVLDTLLADDDLNNIFVSGAKNIYTDKKGKITKSTSSFRDNVQLESVLKKLAQNEGFEFDEFNPYFKFNHKLGVNVTATLPPLSNVPCVFVKCYKDKHATMQTLQEECSISKEIALVLEALCAIKKNILIAGKKSTLKTTLLSAMAKRVASNNRAIIIDSENEIKITGQNYTNYDFSKLRDEFQCELLDSILSVNPEKLFVNSQNDSLLCHLIDKCRGGYKGLVSQITADSTQEAIENLANMQIKHNPSLTFEQAKAKVLCAWDVIIVVKKDEIGRRKLQCISEVNPFSDNIIEDIFTLDCSEHKSKGIIPLFYEDIKNSSLPIGDNIFDANYKHTYHKGINQDIDSKFEKKNINIDILKKFKKELPTPKNEPEETKEIKEEKVQQSEISGEELIKKAQEKFEELKKNAQMRGEFEQELQSIKEPLKESIDDESENQNIQ